MNSHSKSIWDTLLITAQRKSGTAHSNLQKAQLRKEQALGRRKKIEQLIREYTERLRLLQNENHSTAEATNYRQFIAQLQDINQRTSHEIKQAALVYSQAQTALLAAEQERLKHQKLVQRAADKQHKIQHIADIKALDSQSTIQFNLKNKTHQQR